MKNRRYAVTGILLSVVMAFSGCKSLFPLDENPYKQTETTVSVSETTPTYVTESFIPIETPEETSSETTEVTTTPEETTTPETTTEVTTTPETTTATTVATTTETTTATTVATTTPAVTETAPQTTKTKRYTGLMHIIHLQKKKKRLMTSLKVRRYLFQTKLILRGFL